MPSTTVRRHAQHRSAARRRRRSPRGARRRTTTRPPIDDVADVGCRRGEHGDLEGVVGARRRQCARSRARSSSGRRARRPRCARRRASRGWRGRARSPSAAATPRRGCRARRRPAARRARRRAPPRAGRSRRASRCRASAGPRRRAVARAARCRRRGRARSSGRGSTSTAGRAEQVDVGRRSTWVAWTAVNRRSSAPRVGEQLRSACGRRRRGTARSRPAAPTRGRAAGRRARPAHAATTSMAAGSTARTEWMAAPMRTPGPVRSADGPRGPRQRVAVGEPPLRLVELDADAAAAGSTCRAA